MNAATGVSVERLTKPLRELEEVTKLTHVDRRVEGAADEWVAVLWPEAGEAVVFHRGGGGGASPRIYEAVGGGKRARTRVRRYALANGLNRLVTLTFAEPEDSRLRCRRVLRCTLARVRRRLGMRFPYVSVLEAHADGKHLHVHALMSARAARVVAAEWRAGSTHVKRLRGREGIRRGAAYLAKTFDSVGSGGHRYEVAQGFAPLQRTLRATSPKSLWRKVTLEMGGEPHEVVSYVDVGWNTWIAWWDDTLNAAGGSA